MNLCWLDYSICIVLFSGIAFMAFWTRRYTRSVADFLSTNRCAGRYLLTMGEGIAGVGVISFMAQFERSYNAGFPAGWWGAMFYPLGIIMTLSGWLICRYRETRAMTIAQFFEMRYGHRFRVFTGILAWGSGVINFGIFPAITAKFFIHFCGIPEYTFNIGSFEVNATLGVIMALELAVAITFTFWGGQIAVIITDFLQGQIVNIVFLIIMVVFIMKFDWSVIMETLRQAPKGESMLDPFDQGKIPSFNFWFFMIMGFNSVYQYMTWQGSQGYRCSAKSPHEARMANILALWRDGVLQPMVVLIPICIYVTMTSPVFAGEAEAIRSIVGDVADKHEYGRMVISTGLSRMLPIGVMGAFLMVMISAAVSTDDTYLHSWGSIFIQDVYVPLRKNNKPLPPKKHMKLLRMSILGVAVFAWVFSMIFPVRDYVQMFLAITGAIFCGGAGSVLIGGLYWKRATKAGAWAAMTTGSGLAVTGIVVKNILWNYVPNLQQAYPAIGWIQKLPAEFPLNGMHLSFFVSLTAILTYVIVSLITKVDPDFEMDKMLHRGKYAVEEPDRPEKEMDLSTFKGRLQKRFGVNKHFTLGDKFIYFGNLTYHLFFFFAFVTGTILYFNFGSNLDCWEKWWTFKVGLGLVMGVFTTIWFVYGGFRDLVDLFRRLSIVKRNIYDDGSVHAGHNVADEKFEETEKDTEFESGSEES
ncbi:MAG: sodium:solute symporter [Planctomycetota bacterium]